MRLLLDTHALLWWFTDDPRLSARAGAVIADTGNSIHASAACAREIATKQRIGKLDEVPEAAKRYGELIDADVLYICLRHICMRFGPGAGRSTIATHSTGCSRIRRRSF